MKKSREYFNDIKSAFKFRFMVIFIDEKITKNRSGENEEGIEVEKFFINTCNFVHIINI